MKTFCLHALISFFLLQNLLENAVDSASNNKTKPSALEFFKQFQGSQKGDKVKGINELKTYLQTLGYINKKTHHSKTLDNSHKESHTDNDYFDEELESAIKIYQINFNLNATGTLDLKTVSTMAKPRCGYPDIINGTTRMHSGTSAHFNSHFAFFQGSPRWPLDKKTITYAFKPGTRAEVHGPVRESLLQWSNWAPFTFEGSYDYDNADIKISFQRREHGDGFPFDGPGHLLAHASPPTGGVVHFDADENWVLGAVEGGIDFMSVALHELGHVLGLAHSSVEAAIMWPSMRLGCTKDLTDDDTQGMKILYTT